MEGSQVTEDLKRMNEELLNALTGYDLMSRELSGYVSENPDLSERYEKEVGEAFGKENGEESIRALLVSPGKHPERVTIGRDLASLKAAVGGSIQAVYPYEDDVALICNEEGKINGMELNRALFDESGEIYDVIAGDFLITGLTPDDFGSLSEDLFDKYEKLFYDPERFIDFAGTLTVFTVREEAVPLRDVGEKDLMEETDTLRETEADYTAGPKRSGFYYETGLGFSGREEEPERTLPPEEEESEPVKTR